MRKASQRPNATRTHRPGRSKRRLPGEEEHAVRKQGLLSTIKKFIRNDALKVKTPLNGDFLQAVYLGCAQWVFLNFYVLQSIFENYISSGGHE